MDENPYQSPQFSDRPATPRKRAPLQAYAKGLIVWLAVAFILAWLLVGPRESPPSYASTDLACVIFGGVWVAVGVVGAWLKSRNLNA